MHKMEYEMEDLKNKSKADQLRKLIKMLGSKMLEDFDEHEEEEKELSDKVEKSGVESGDDYGQEEESEIELKPKRKSIDFKMEMIKADKLSSPQVDVEIEGEEVDPEEMKEMMRKYFTQKPKFMDKKTKIVTLPMGMGPGKKIEFTKKK